jgi:hypothetical protein
VQHPPAAPQAVPAVATRVPSLTRQVTPGGLRGPKPLGGVGPRPTQTRSNLSFSAPEFVPPPIPTPIRGGGGGGGRLHPTVSSMMERPEPPQYTNVEEVRQRHPPDAGIIVGECVEMCPECEIQMVKGADGTEQTNRDWASQPGKIGYDLRAMFEGSIMKAAATHTSGALRLHAVPFVGSGG